MSYRDNYTAALARAEAAERRLAELRAERSEDQAKREALERELAEAKEALALIRRSPSSLSSQAPASGAGVVALVLVGGLIFLGAVGLAGTSSSRSYTVPYTMPPLPSFELPTELPRLNFDSCDPEVLGLEEAKPLPHFEISGIEGCTLPEGEAPLLAIDSEEELQRLYRCTGEAKKRGSGLDFQRFRLLVARRTLLTGDRLEAASVHDDGKALHLVARIVKPCRLDGPLGTKAGALLVLVPKLEGERELKLESCYGVMGSCVQD